MPRKPAASETKRERTRARTILRLLKRRYPDARISLDFRNPFELYVATVLSAQCTDVRVNQVTPALFHRFPTPAALATADRSEVEQLIRSTGFFRNKAKSLQGGAARLVEAYGGELPGTMEELLTLPGIGRKTANVILGNAFDIPGITVDTHVRRLSRRLGFTQHNDPVKIEFDLMEIFPAKEWTQLSHLLIHHGRQTCSARRPSCGACSLAKHCPSAADG